MFFALGMERVEARLRQVAVGEDDVEEFLEQARPNEVRELFRFGIGRALELFRGRRRTSSRTARQRATGAPSRAGGSRDADMRDTVQLAAIPVTPRGGDSVRVSQSRAS